MKIALFVLAALLPTLALADGPQPYILHDGRAAAPGTAPARKARSSRGRRAAAGARGHRAARRGSGGEGFSRPLSTPQIARVSGPVHSAPPASSNGPSPESAPGAKVLTAGQQPVYSNPGNDGTQSVNGGGFVAITPGQANDVDRSPGITQGAPEKAPSGGTAGGGGASSNGP